MKKVSFPFRANAIAVMGLLLSGVFLASCQKSMDGGTQVPVAGLMAFNLAPDVSGAGITLSGNNLTQTPLSYTSYTGNYLQVYTGSRDIVSYDFQQNKTLASSNQNFEEGKFYSLFVLGAGNNYRNVVARDNFDSLSATSGQAYIRYINAIPDSSAPAVVFQVGGNNVVNTNAPYASVSDFVAVAPGDVNVSVDNESGIAANRTITVAGKKVYTVLLLGEPNATDSTRKIQIRFIENGQLSE